MNKAYKASRGFIIIIALMNPTKIFSSPINQIAAPLPGTSSNAINPTENSLKQNNNTSIQDNNEQTKKKYLYRLKKNPNDEMTRLYLADYYLSKRRDLKALRVIKEGLRLNPNSLYLLMKLSDIETYLTAYAPALQTNKKILTLDPDNSYATEYFSDANKVLPRYVYGVNEVGFITDNAYVTGFEQIWDASSLYYTRDTDYGRFGGRINYAARQGYNAPQYELDLSPVLNRDLSFNLIATYANRPELFPYYSYGGQANINLNSSLQFTGGGIYSNISPTYFMTYIAGVNYPVGNYLLSFIPYYFVPQTNVKSLLLTGMIKRFFTTEDHSLAITMGIGHSPNLANLTTVNFIVIKNDYANLNYEFPILSHRMIVALQLGYQRWQFPTGEVNHFYDTNVGLKYRF